MQFSIAATTVCRSLPKRGEPRRWTRGLVVIGSLDEAAGLIDTPVATVAGPVPTFGTLAAVRIGGMPALLVSDARQCAPAVCSPSPCARCDARHAARLGRRDAVARSCRPIA